MSRVRSDYAVMEAIAMSGAVGLTRSQIINQTRFAPDTVYRRVKFFLMNQLCFIDAEMRQEGVGTRRRQVVRAYMAGVNWLNAKNRLMRRKRDEHTIN